MDINEVAEALKGMTVEDLTLLKTDIEALLKKKALAALEAKEAELNELRVLAGMKRKPGRRAKK